jgi:hypothetical protein
MRVTAVTLAHSYAIAINNRIIRNRKNEIVRSYCRNVKGQFSRHNYIESGMVGHFPGTKDCGYGCKVFTCTNCKHAKEMHYSVYGCSE